MTKLIICLLAILLADGIFVSFYFQHKKQQVFIIYVKLIFLKRLCLFPENHLYVVWFSSIFTKVKLIGNIGFDCLTIGGKMSTLVFIFSYCTFNTKFILGLLKEHNFLFFFFFILMQADSIYLLFILFFYSFFIELITIFQRAIGV